MKSLTPSVLLFVLLCVSWGCDAPKNAPKPSKKTVAPPTKAKKVKNVFELAFLQCKIAGAGSRPRDCDALDARIDQRLVQAGPAAIDTLVPYLTDERENMRSLAIWWLVHNVPKTILHKLEANPKLVSRASAKALLNTLKVNADGKRGARVYVEFAVHVGTLTGQDDVVIQHITQLADERARANGVAALMRYSGMKSFDAVTRFAQEASPKSLKIAALSAPLRMPRWDKAARAQLCPWYGRFLSEAPTELDNPVMQGMTRCGGKSITRLIEVAQKRIDSGTYGGVFAIKMGEVCARRGVSAKKRLLDGQCDRIQTMFTQGIKTKTLSWSIRKKLLWQMLLMSKTTELLDPFVKHPDAQVASEAKRLVGIAKKIKKLKEKPNKR